jgi:NADPH:quinone reductase-like Zn-dependent oxidoreductase
MLKRNQLSHQICDRYSLQDIVAAHERVESGQAIGNVVVGRD